MADLLDELAAAMLTRRWVALGTHDRIIAGRVTSIGGGTVVVHGESVVPKCARIDDVLTMAVA